MSDDLFCTNCETVVRLARDYDGYKGECDCSSLYMAPGSGEKPTTWVKADDIGSPDGFTITEGVWNQGGFVGRVAVCTRCNSSEDVSVSFRPSDLSDYKVRAAFDCSNCTNHDVAFYNPSVELGDFLPEAYNGDSD